MAGSAQEAKWVTIYALADPDDHRIYYVGASLRPKVRYHQHLQAAKNPERTAIRDWLRGLVGKGQRPVLLPLKRVRPAKAAAEEHLWIAALKMRGHPLTNVNNVYFGKYTDSERARCRVRCANHWQPRQYTKKANPAG